MFFSTKDRDRECEMENEIGIFLSFLLFISETHLPATATFATIRFYLCVDCAFPHGSSSVAVEHASTEKINTEWKSSSSSSNNSSRRMSAVIWVSNLREANVSQLFCHFHLRKSVNSFASSNGEIFNYFLQPPDTEYTLKQPKSTKNAINLCFFIIFYLL